MIRRLAQVLALALLLPLLAAPVGYEPRRAEIGFPPLPDGRSIDAPATGLEPAQRESGTLVLARSILEERIATYPILEGSTVDFGDTGEGSPEALAYYKSGRIVVDPAHTTSLERIIDHEIWHIIDWRDNGRIDWDEDIPPANAAEYRQSRPSR